jgi:hypothetical protein
MVTDIATTESMNAAAAARISSTVPSSAKNVFTIGKKSAVPAGTVQERVAVPPPAVPAKNQTLPLWPSAQFAPVGSSRGLTGVGADSAHCHHVADHSPYECPYGFALGGSTPGFVFAASIADGDARKEKLIPKTNAQIDRFIEAPFY